MAYVDIELTEEELAGTKKEYFKFQTIGDTLTGRFVRTQPTTGNFAKEGQLDYVFRIRMPDGTTGETVLTPPYNAALGLEKATKAGLMKVGAGVILRYDSNLNVGKEHPQKIFKLKVDPNPVAKAAPKPPPPVVSGDDDLPF